MRNFHPIQPERAPTPPQSQRLTASEWLLIIMGWVAVGAVALAIINGHV
jgi:hypothetical protein